MSVIIRKRFDRWSAPADTDSSNQWLAWKTRIGAPLLNLSDCPPLIQSFTSVTSQERNSVYLVKALAWLQSVLHVYVLMPIFKTLDSQRNRKTLNSSIKSKLLKMLIQYGFKAFVTRIHSQVILGLPSSCSHAACTKMAGELAWFLTHFQVFQSHSSQGCNTEEKQDSVTHNV